MQKRKSHTKSRNGCMSCKAKHVKCDEQGPPCANCIARKISDTCTYVRRPSTAAVTKTAGSSKKPVEIDFNNVKASPENKVAFESRRLLELELMHRWVTVTYKSLCALPDKEDEPFYILDLPRGALKHDFLLNGIFSMTALEMVACGQPDATANSKMYVRAGIEYYATASAQFREHLNVITKDSFWCAYIFSFIVIVVNMAIPQLVDEEEEDKEQSDILAHTALIFDLLWYFFVLVREHPDWLYESPLSPMLVTTQRLAAIPLSDDDGSLKIIFARLKAVVDGMILDKELHDTYEKVVNLLSVCYVEDAKDLIKGFCSVFPGMVGRDFVASFQRSEPMALFILMHWGVLLDRVGGLAWWVDAVGKALVFEISEKLLHSQREIEIVPEWWDAIKWARGEVGLLICTSSKDSV